MTVSMGVQEKTQWISEDEAQAFLQSDCSVAKLVGEDRVCSTQLRRFGEHKGFSLRSSMFEDRTQELKLPRFFDCLD